jgi:HD superfamily phosphohydrolase
MEQETTNKDTTPRIEQSTLLEKEQALLQKEKELLEKENKLNQQSKELDEYIKLSQTLEGNPQLKNKIKEVIDNYYNNPSISEEESNIPNLSEEEIEEDFYATQIKKLNDEIKTIKQQYNDLILQQQKQEAENLINQTLSKYSKVSREELISYLLMHPHIDLDEAAKYIETKNKITEQQIIQKYLQQKQQEVPPIISSHMGSSGEESISNVLTFRTARENLLKRLGGIT